MKSRWDFLDSVVVIVTLTLAFFIPDFRSRALLPPSGFAKRWHLWAFSWRIFVWDAFLSRFDGKRLAFVITRIGIRFIKPQTLLRYSEHHALAPTTLCSHNCPLLSPAGLLDCAISKDWECAPFAVLSPAPNIALSSTKQFWVHKWMMCENQFPCRSSSMCFWFSI